MISPSICLGIDCAAQSFVVALLRSADEIKPLITRFLNTTEGISAFLTWIGELQLDPKTTLLCLEATGSYSELLCYRLYDQGWILALESPQKVKRAFNKRQKTDPVDARHIAEYAWRFTDRLQPWTPNDELIEQLRALLSLREQLRVQQTAQSNHLKAFERKVVQSTLVAELCRKTLAHLQEQINQIDAEIKRVINHDPILTAHAKRLRKIPGVGLLLFTNIAVLTKGFTLRPTARSLACYLGICPHEYSSGSSVRGKSRSSGFGPSRLRKILYLSSLNLRRTSQEYEAYFDRKVAEGKPPRLVLNNIANKLLRVICAIIRTEQEFDPAARQAFILR